MNLIDRAWIVWHILTQKKCTLVTKAQTSLGIEGEDVKNIISPYDGGYILIKWS